jgi:hypothetical protein
VLTSHVEMVTRPVFVWFSKLQILDSKLELALRSPAEH